MEENLETFLTLCKELNYSRTARIMHLTQPAISKKIRILESRFKTKLFIYDGRILRKTKSCEILENYAKSLKYNLEKIEKELLLKGKEEIKIGATKSIGEKLLTNNVLDIVKEEDLSLTFLVENTNNLLNLLDEGKLDFLVVEGNFNKEKYHHIILKNEDFVGICSKYHRFLNKEVEFKDIFEETFILREPGSGTRNILELELDKKGYSVKSFNKIHTISSFNVIKALVKNDVGISFLYKTVVKDEILKDEIGTFKIKNLNLNHEFNIVYLKNTVAKKYIERFFQKMYL